MEVKQEAEPMDNYEELVTKQEILNPEKLKLEMKSFQDFPLKPELVQVIGVLFETPTEVQSGCLLDAMEGKDILCQSRVGSGKATLCVLATLNQVNVDVTGIYVVAICPTRQLVLKVYDCYKIMSKNLPSVKIDTFGQKAGCISGANGVHVGLGTPGRVIRALRNKKVDFSLVKHIILYEADKMLSKLDMRIDIGEICRLLPRDVQVMMFSEKFSKEVRQICKTFLHQPFKVFVDDEAKYISMNLDQFYVKIANSDKYNKLLEILKILHFSLIIVYVKSPVLCQTITNLLKQEKLSITSYHLGMKFEDRMISIQNFKRLKKRILVVAKVLEPEVDISIANVVINYDRPVDVDLFLQHVTPASRSCETKGLTITFLPEYDDLKMIQELEDWYGATFTELPSQIQLEVTSYDCTVTNYDSADTSYNCAS